MNLAHLVIDAARRAPNDIAVVHGDHELTYGELDALAGRLARVLRELGVEQGDRVVLWAPKSCELVSAMQAVLRLGATYVPIDTDAPTARAAAIASDCAARVVVATAGRSVAGVPLLALDDESWKDGPRDDGVSSAGDEGLAYVLYTSGSTGTPKGVCISHRAALAFVSWAADLLRATPQLRFANHAPFQFDLSVFDLYVAFAAGARVVLVPEAFAYSPESLVALLRSEAITVWYSVPTALISMIERGGLLDDAGLSLELVLFAGEVMPAKYLRRLRSECPRARLFNLYGPTETNVCTHHEVVAHPDEIDGPAPIGKAACGNAVWAQREDGARASVGEKGELVVEGPTVMSGYWGRPPLAGRRFATGDIVRVGEGDSFAFVGRRDRMLKVRGHRIEPGDVETALTAHEAIREAAVVVEGEGLDARLVAFVTTSSERRPSLIEVKRHLASRLPRSMIVDRVYRVADLPRTATGKIDHRALASGLGGGE